MTDSGSMSFIGHLTELRRTLIWSFASILVATVAAWFFSDQIIELLLRPTRAAGQDTLYFQAPMEAFLLKLKASLAVGVLVVFPIILYRVYMFVMPGLLPKEKRVVTPLLSSATALFYVGVSFCFFVLLPMVIRFALGFASEGLQPWLTAGSYFEMAWRLCLAFGLFFELPIVVFALSWAGVVHPRTLLRGWRYAMICILVASAAFTPPDIISQILLGGPVMVLYIGSVLLSLAVRKRRDEARARDDEASDDDPDDDPDGGSGPEDDGPKGGTGSDAADSEPAAPVVADEPPIVRPADGAEPRRSSRGVNDSSAGERGSNGPLDNPDEGAESAPNGPDRDDSD